MGDERVPSRDNLATFGIQAASSTAFSSLTAPPETPRPPEPRRVQAVATQETNVGTRTVKTASPEIETQNMVRTEIEKLRLWYQTLSEKSSLQEGDQEYGVYPVRAAG